MRDRETETKEFLCQVRVMTVCGEYGALEVTRFHS
jgi:hypothetical protein